MPIGPFQGNGEGTSLDHEDPISGTTRQAVKAVNQQTAQQAQAAKQNFVDQLYGNVPTGDETDPTTNPGHAIAQAQKPAQSLSPSGLTPAANPQEQAQLDATRKKLSELLHKEYVSSAFGEEAQQKRREREAEEEQLKAQEEEEAAQEEAAKKARMDESLQSFQSHGKGPAQLGDPVAVTQAKTRAEINRGTSG